MDPVFWLEEFHGLYSPLGHKESDTTERLSLTPEPVSLPREPPPPPPLAEIVLWRRIWFRCQLNRGIKGCSGSCRVCFASEGPGTPDRSWREPPAGEVQGWSQRQPLEARWVGGFRDLPRTESCSFPVSFHLPQQEEPMS